MTNIWWLTTHGIILRAALLIKDEATSRWYCRHIEPTLGICWKGLMRLVVLASQYCQMILLIIVQYWANIWSALASLYQTTWLCTDTFTNHYRENWVFSRIGYNYAHIKWYSVGVAEYYTAIWYLYKPLPRKLSIFAYRVQLCPH